MTEEELQDLIGLKKYEQPEEGYFDDFLVEFQQRQRAEMLHTSARGLLFERAKAWIGEFSSMRSIRWVLGGGLAYAAIALFMSIGDAGRTMELSSANIEQASDINHDTSKLVENLESTISLNSIPVSMEFAHPVDFSSPKPVFSTEEKFF